MQKLIKINKSHYIVVDDSEIKEGDKFYCTTNKVIFTAHTIEYLEKYNKLEDSNHNFYVNSKYAKKITHSTQPLENINFVDEAESKIIPKIKPLSLSEVEEAINGYSIYQKALDFTITSKSKIYIDDEKTHNEVVESLISFHKELVKDKLFTVEDMLGFYEYFIYKSGTNSIYEALKQYIQSLLPQTEWDVTFDEQGKISLAL
jgi:hypothetical protein